MEAAVSRILLSNGLPALDVGHIQNLYFKSKIIIKAVFIFCISSVVNLPFTSTNRLR